VPALAGPFQNSAESVSLFVTFNIIDSCYLVILAVIVLYTSLFHLNSARECNR
jgi:high-affinity Fe2+/Pb2+ permease